MLLASTLGVLRRRWVMVILGLAIVTFGMAAVTKEVKPQYQATTTVLLSEPEPNPYSDVAGDASVFTRAVAAIVSDSQTSDELSARGNTSSYSVAVSDAVRSSLTVTAYSPLPELAGSGAAAVVTEIGTSAARLQATLGVPAGYRITIRPLDTISVKPYTKNRVRLLALAATGGVTVLVLAVFAVEATSRRRGDVGIVRALSRMVWRRSLEIGAVAILLVAALGFTIKAPHQYQASAVIVLLPPRLPPNPNLVPRNEAQENLFLSYGESFNVLAQLATIEVTQPGSAAALARDGATGRYSVQNWVAGPNPVDTTATPTPYVAIGATANDANSAVVTVRQVASVFAGEIATLQDASGAPRNTWVTVYTAVPPQEFQVPLSKARALGALGALAVLLGVICLRGGRVASRAALRHKPLVGAPAGRMRGGDLPQPAGRP